MLPRGLQGRRREVSPRLAAEPFSSVLGPRHRRLLLRPTQPLAARLQRELERAEQGGTVCGECIPGVLPAVPARVRG